MITFQIRDEAVSEVKTRKFADSEITSFKVCAGGKPITCDVSPAVHSLADGEHIDADGEMVSRKFTDRMTGRDISYLVLRVRNLSAAIKVGA